MLKTDQKKKKTFRNKKIFLLGIRDRDNEKGRGKRVEGRWM